MTEIVWRDLMNVTIISKENCMIFSTFIVSFCREPPSSAVQLLVNLPESQNSRFYSVSFSA